MKSEYDIIVVGAGPAGSMAAAHAKKNNLSVCLLEKTRDIGYPVRCGEAIGENALKQFVKPKDTWIAEYITSCSLVSPNGVHINVPFTHENGYILNRRIFDYDLSRIAAEKGVEIYTKAFVKSLIINDEKICGVNVDYLGKNIKIKSKIIIAADGVDTKIGRFAGIKTNVKMKDMESCVQYSVSNVDIKRKCLTMYVGMKYAPGGYLWIFPKGDRFANIGIGISGKYSKEKSAKKYLDEFMDKHFPDAAILTTMCGGVPCGKPLKKPIEDGLLIVGDAAQYVNPLTGGGIASAMKSGMFGGIVASDAIAANDCSKFFLEQYVNLVMNDFGNRHNKLYKIKETLNKLSDEDLNNISDKIFSIPKEKRNLRKVFTAAVIKKPSLIIDVIKIFSSM